MHAARSPRARPYAETGPTRARLAAAALAFVLISPVHARADAPEWGAMPLPGGRAALMPAVGLSPETPRALALVHAIRVLHAGPTRALDLRADPVGGEAEDVPLPLAEDVWRGVILRGRDARGSLAYAILAERDAARLYCALMSLDAGTLAWIAAEPELLRRLARGRDAGTFAAAAPGFHVKDGAVVVPGGPDAAAFWTDVVGESPTLPAAFLPALLARDEGRLAYFFDTLAHLPRASLAYVLGGGDTTPDARRDRLRALYRVFADFEAGWRMRDNPFTRMPYDPAFVLGALAVTPDGLLLGPRSEGVWEAVFARQDPSVNRPVRAGDAGATLDPAFLLRHLTLAPPTVRHERFRLVSFAQRRAADTVSGPPAETVRVLRGLRRYPMLSLTLERMGVNAPSRHVAALGAADRIEQVSGARLGHALALFQGSIALVDRGVWTGALDPAGAGDLLDGLFAVVPDPAPQYGPAVAAWMESALLPALGRPAGTDADGPGAEEVLLSALAGLGGHEASRPRRTIEWEDHTYHVDVAAPELARLGEIRRQQGGNVLDAALGLAALARDAASVASRPAARALADRLSALGERLEPIESSERPGAQAPMSVASAIQDVVRELRSADRARDEAQARLGTLAGAVLADVIASCVYAVALGDPGGQAFLAGNVARRHDFGLSRRQGDTVRLAWEFPAERSGDGFPWHVRGALLGLDVGLARLALRRTTADLPPGRPTLNESDKRSFVLSVALTNPYALAVARPEPVLAALSAGRARMQAAMSDAAAASGLVAALALDGARANAVAWAAAHEPEDLPRLISLGELYYLGGRGEVPRGIGVAQTLVSGCLCLAFPSPPGVERYLGRGGSGLLATRVADLALRVVEALGEFDLPLALAPGVLAAATQDFVDEVRMTHGDDWLALTWHARSLARERLIDYIAALSAGGPLVPADAGSERESRP